MVPSARRPLRVRRWDGYALVSENRQNTSRLLTPGAQYRRRCHLLGPWTARRFRQTPLRTQHAYFGASMIADHAELTPFLEKALEKGAWIIMMYHGIGIPELWGYYPIEEFAKDLDMMKANDFWNGNMDSIVLYIQERNRFRIDLLGMEITAGLQHYDLAFSDGLDNVFYDQPLTLNFTFAPEEIVRTVRFEPPLGELGELEVSAAGLQFSVNVAPDERPYSLFIE